MRSFLTLLVVGLAVLSVVEGASMVRFVNMVPAKKAFTALYPKGGIVAATRDFPAAPAPNANAFIMNQWAQFPMQFVDEQNSVNADRVGLEYYPTGVAGDPSVNENTVVWTESMASLLKMSALTNPSIPTAGASAPHVAPFYWANAVPPLRGYHTFLDASNNELPIHDRISNSFDNTVGQEGNRDPNEAGNCNALPASYDCYEQSALKADGIAGLISFAAGTYQLSAYGIQGDIVGGEGDVHKKQSRELFSNSLTSFTFEDGKLYTIIATGRWDTTTPANSKIVLNLLEESTAPTTFGMASIRFFNGLSTNTDTSGNVKALSISQQRNNNAREEIVASLAFNSQSQYVDVRPGTTRFPLVDADGSVSSNPDTSTAKLPGGSRVTSFCGVTDEENAVVFCRMIPTRVVSYVRLVLDTQNLQTIVSGKFGPQKLGETSISVWQSYDYALPEFAADQYSVTPSNMFNVIPAVNPGEVSGYGEVHVPLFIMDSANSPRIGWSCFDSATPSKSLACANTVNYHNSQTAADATQFGFQGGYAAAGVASRMSTHKFSARFKRVNLYVKTDGMATLAIRQISKGAAQQSNLFDSPNAKGTGTGQQTYDDYRIHHGQGNPGASNQIQANPHFGFIDVDGVSNAGAFVDRFMEPGEYYSMYIKACDRKFTAPGAANTGVSCSYLDFTPAAFQSYMHLPTNMPAPGSLLAGWSRDQSIAETSEDIDNGQAKLQLTPFDQQNFQGTLLFTTPSVGDSNSGFTKTFTIPAASKYYTDNIGIVAGAARLAGYIDSGRNTVPGGTYKNTDQGEKADVILPPENTWFLIPAGSYTYTFTPANAIPNNPNKCVMTIPASNQVTFEAGQRYTLYVMNEYSCSVQAPAPETSKLVFVSARSRAATAAVSTETPILTASASSLTSTVAVFIAALLAVFALV